MSPAKILLVDDSLTVLALEQLVLRSENFELLTAHSGREAIEMSMRLRPDLILLDIVMPGMDGIECCRRLKANPLTQHIPIIMVTTKGNPTVVEAALKAGCSEFTTKPIDKIDLVRKVRRVMRARATSDEQVLP